MALSIKNKEAHRLARELADLTGENLTDVVITALRERLERERGRSTENLLRTEIAQIQHRIAALPRLDEQTGDDLIGYDASGIPK